MKERIYAYPILEPPPRLRVAGLRLDGAPRPSLLRPADFRADVFEEGTAWRRAELDLELAANVDAVREFEEQHGELAAVVVAQCTATRVRQSARLARSRRDGARWEGTIELDRDNYRGRALLRPLLIAAVGGVAHRPVAEPDGWAVYFDEPTFLSPGGRLRLRWVDFRGVGADPLVRQFADSTHVVRFGAGDDPPEVWLNASFAGLEPLLDDGERRRRRAGRAQPGAIDYRAGRLDGAAGRRHGGHPRGGGRQGRAGGLARGRVAAERPAPGPAPGRAGEAAARAARVGGHRVAVAPGACEFQARAGAAVGDLVRADEAVRRLIQTKEEGEEP